MVILSTIEMHCLAPITIIIIVDIYGPDIQYCAW